ncbi:SPOR domain-containing protein [Clostridium amazonitimonense]|uniref:SPOR domain-containing protein n=1 Tax=Clostridium amazonitimonense TaxID=1499689 RepID=UPI000509AC0C|nr:SPOR domain-containing protein [Clostridium amazonitimonense]
MNYTRYNYKKKKEGNHIIVVFLFGVCIMSVILGSGLSKILIKNKDDSSESPPDKNIVLKEQDKATLGNEKINFYMVQGGVFSKIENAEENKKKLNELGYDAFIIKDEEKHRVILGIFDEEQSNTLLKEIKEKGTEITRLGFEINKSNLEDYEIGEIINANIKVLSKLREKDVKSIQTEEIKKWVSSLKPIEKKGKNNELLEEVKNFTLSLPEEIKKEELNSYYENNYKFLKSMSKTK